MIALVSINEVNEHLRRDFIDGDTDLVIKIIAASSVVMSYLNLDEDEYTDSNGASVAPEVVKLAVSILAADFYLNREGDNASFSQGGLPANVRALLASLRDPTVA